ncbi:MAG TPA: hypothetical protein VIC62_21135 [Nakamurella sp.]|jgi:hypothetical protein
MSIQEELKASTEAVRSVADRTGEVSRFEWAMQRYLSAEIFEARLDRTPESREGSRPAPMPRPIRRLG